MLMRTPPPPPSSLHSSLRQSNQVEAGNLAAIDPPPLLLLSCNGSEDQCNMEVFVSSLKRFAQQIDTGRGPQLALADDGARPRREASRLYGT